MSCVICKDRAFYNFHLEKNGDKTCSRDCSRQWQALHEEPSSISYNHATHKYEHCFIDRFGDMFIVIVPSKQLELPLPEPEPLKPPIGHEQADACQCKSCR